MNYSAMAMAILQMLVPLVIVVIVGGAGAAAMILFWTKSKADMILAFFHDNKHMYGRLLKPDPDNNCLWLGVGEGREKYLLDPNKQEWADWPGGLPRIFQIRIRVHQYKRNVPVPYDVDRHNSNISAKALRIATDEVMLRGVWKDVREAAGLRNKGGDGSRLVLIVLIILVIVGIGNLLMNMQVQAILKAIWSKI